jgi:hypothetical protein
MLSVCGGLQIVTGSAKLYGISVTVSLTITEFTAVPAVWTTHYDFTTNNTSLCF